MRNSSYTEEIADQIINLLEKGNFFSTACEICGVKYATGKSWLNRGKSGEDEPWATFYTRVKQAEAKAESEAVKVIKEASRDRTVNDFKSISDESGVIRTEETTKTIMADTNSAKFFLERKFPEKWGRKKADLVEAIAALVEFGILPESCLEVAKTETSDFVEKLRTAWSNILKEEN